MKPLGWRMGANDYNSREELERVAIKARHRRWETAEINAELLALVPQSIDWCGCDRCDVCGFYEDWVGVPDDLPVIPRVTMLDAYKAKGGR